jgi:predicted RNase H-like HicB family nuclease
MGNSAILNYETAPDTLGGMITEYISGALKRARFEKIEDRNPYYGEIPGLKGVWATGKTLTACRRNLSEVLDGWIIVRLRKSLPLPKLSPFS